MHVWTVVLRLKPHCRVFRYLLSFPLYNSHESTPRPVTRRRPQGAARPPGLSVLGVLSLPTVARVAEEPFPGEDEEKRFGHFYNIYFQPFFRADS